MIREIKFRYWDHLNNCYLPNDHGEHDYRVIVFEGVVWDTIGEDWYELPEVVPEQYTGIKDANGVDIYEGDVLSSKNWACLCFVAWKDGGLVLVNGEESHTIGYELSNHEYTYNEIPVVIGNIHENAEMLEATK